MNSTPETTSVVEPQPNRISYIATYVYDPGRWGQFSVFHAFGLLQLTVLHLFEIYGVVVGARLILTNYDVVHGPAIFAQCRRK